MPGKRVQCDNETWQALDLLAEGNTLHLFGKNFPAETEITELAIKRVKNGRLYLIPASEETRGHGTTGNAKYYSNELRELLQTAPRRAM